MGEDKLSPFKKEAEMRRIITLSIVSIFTFFISIAPLGADIDYGAPPVEMGTTSSNLISMDFQDANLKTVLKIFSQQSGLNFVASQNVQDRTVTIYFDGVTIEDALNHIINANSLMYMQEPGSNIFIVKESGKSAIETMTKIYELKYAQLASPPSESSESDDGDEGSGEPEILLIIRNLLSENGKVVADKRSNRLIVTDVISQFDIIEEVLETIDVKIPQVIIEAEILETTTTVADQLGVDWSGTLGVYRGPSKNTIWPLRGAHGKDNSSGEGFASVGTMNFSSMTATLKAILSNTDTRILARPKILTLNNETAIIGLKSETAVASITSTDTGEENTETTSAERIDTGITLEVTPQINRDGYITMRIEPTVIVPVLSSFFQGSGSDAKFVDPQTRSAKTTVRVKNGETVIIGGLISKEDTYVSEKVPFLGDIPLIGSAFRYKTKAESDRELLIFITPHVVKDNALYVLGDISDREQEKPKAVREKKINSLLDILAEK